MSWQGLVLYKTFPSRCCGFEAMEAERTIVRKQAFPDVTLRSGGECRATSGRSACPNDMGSNAPLACNVWMRKRKRTNWWKFFLKRKILALRRRKKIIKGVMMLKRKSQIRWEVWWLSRDVCLGGLRWLGGNERKTCFELLLLFEGMSLRTALIETVVTSTGRDIRQHRVIARVMFHLRNLGQRSVSRYFSDPSSASESLRKSVPTSQVI